DAVDPDDARKLEQEAQALGVIVIDGLPGSGGGAPRFLVADEETLKRLGAVLESRGLKALGAAVRTTLAAYQRTAFTLSFAGGARMDLAAEARVMGILNLTPDSFSGGSTSLHPGNAVDEAGKMVEEGADLIDVGGESTRPGASPIPEDEELRRVVPVIEALTRELSVRAE